MDLDDHGALDGDVEFATRDFSQPIRRGRDPVPLPSLPVPGNPKARDAHREGRPRLDLLEPEANRATAQAMAYGADKYGIQNYVTVPIHFRTYLGAIERHIDALKSGEDIAPDSGVEHLGHIAADVHVVMAAAAAGTLVDDRGPQGSVS